MYIETTRAQSESDEVFKVVNRIQALTEKLKGVVTLVTNHKQREHEFFTK